MVGNRFERCIASCVQSHPGWGVRYTSFSSAAIGTVSNDWVASTLFVYLVSCAEAGCHWVGRMLLRGS